MAEPVEATITMCSGLRLSIAKSIVDIYGGKIWADSELGKGTTFFIELPAGK